MKRVDLLVLGGGPAGATVAALAAGMGLDVLLVERSAFPRDKVCGEFVSAEGCAVLERLGLLSQLVDDGGVWMGALRVTSRGGARLDLPLPRLAGNRSAGLGVSRALLDTRLLELARKRGARVLERHEAFAAEIENGRVAGIRVREVGHGGPARLVLARLVVAADGRRSFLARRFHPGLCDPRRSGPRSWFGLKAHFSAPRSATDGRVELQLFDGGYVGLAPVERRRVNVCLLVRVAALRACSGRPQRLFEERLRPVQRILGTAHPVGGWKAVGPLRFGMRRAASHGVLFVGDAAGTVDPFCGEGMAHALCGAELAADFAQTAAGRGRVTPDLARAYRRAWRDAFSGVLRRARFVGGVFATPALAGPALRLLSSSERLAAPLVAATRAGRRA